MKPLSAKDPQVIGEFRLRARLGSGGMGQVYLGFSPAGRAVAVKVVHSHVADDHDFLERFRREVEAASKVSGLYAAAVVASGVADDPPWLATAYVPGPSLAVLVDSSGPLPEEAIWRLAAGLAEALRNVHDAGLVHRDLKPPNVLIADDGPHVIDFGISRAFDGTQLTTAGMLFGTPGYMPPEQAEGEPAGPASDVFALGCVLAYAATGKPPFGTGSPAHILHRVATAEPDLGSVSPQLRQVIEACLAKAPAQRPGLTDLAGMIAAAGPPAHARLGSFWPESVANRIAAAQAAAVPETTAPAGAAPGAPTPEGAAPEAAAPEAATPEAATPEAAAPEAATPEARDPGVRTPTEVSTPVSAVPRTVRAAILLMWLGLAVTVADLILSLMVLGRYHGELAQAQHASLTQAEHAASQLQGAMALGVAADIAGLVGWAWLAVACRRGGGWTRAAGTALIAIYSICALIVVFVTHDDPGPRFATIAVWTIGLAAAVLLWSRPAGRFFARRRER
jgi:Protein kinase domain